MPHNVTDVQAWDADFVAFSSHKMCGPSGIGVLWGREALLDAMPPFLGGGNMIADVRLDGFTPRRFRPSSKPARRRSPRRSGCGAAVDFLEDIGMADVRRHEMEIAALRDRHAHRAATATTSAIHGPTQRRGPRRRRSASPSATSTPTTCRQVLDQRNVCVRAGHHCAKPLMRLLGVNATARASFYLYNDSDDVDALADALDGASDIFGL